MKKLIITAIIGVFFVSSCQKSIFDENALDISYELLDSSSLSILSSLNPEDIGEQHNIYLNNLINLRRNYPEKPLDSIFYNADTNLSIGDKDFIYNFIISNRNIDSAYSIVNNNFQSDLAKEIFSDIYYQINTEDNYENLVFQINSYMATAESELDGWDLCVLKIYSETSKKSARFWYTEYIPQGGEDFAAPGWVQADGMGAAQASVSWALVAAFTGPAAPATYFWGVALGAALSSTMRY